jgi:DNA-binding IclR family transcriptional regulator
VKKHIATGRYQLTPKVMEIGYNYLEADTLVDVANPFLAELANATGETTNMTEPYGNQMVYVARIVGHQCIPIHMPIGSRIPMYCTGSGRAYLSTLQAVEAHTLLQSSKIKAHTPHTYTDVESIMGLLAIAREKGYACNNEELFLGDMSIAAPIINNQGTAVAVIHVLAPNSRWTLIEAEKKIGPLLLDCARSISNSIRTLT